MADSLPVIMAVITSVVREHAMAEKTPEQVRADILGEMDKIENALSTARNIQRVAPNLRTPGQIKRATAKREQLKKMLAEHDAKHPPIA